jgi:hypothetical protein
MRAIQPLTRIVRSGSTFRQLSTATADAATTAAPVAAKAPFNPLKATGDAVITVCAFGGLGGLVCYFVIILSPLPSTTHSV